MNVHFLGIGGSGSSSIAAIAQYLEYKITGCDKNPFTEFTKNFNQQLLFVGHAKSHLKNIDILAITPAILSLDPNNEELLEAKKRGIETITWQQFMGKYLQKDKFVIAVCGTHGKSTTTAMIGLMLEDAGFDPTVELGAIVPRWKANYRIGKSKYFVTEADEFNDNFLNITPDITIITNIEMDHPEYFKDFNAVKKSFAKFLKLTKNKIFANQSDKGVLQTLRLNLQGCKLNITDYSKSLIDFPLKIPGRFNILNSKASMQVGSYLGIDPQKIQKTLTNFTGLSRRFEYLGQFKGAKIYTDFAHHPTEIKVTIEAAREKFPDKRIWVVFQPHMFSRTKYLFDDFVTVFRILPVNQIIITDIYPSREIDTGIVNSQQLVDSIGKSTVKYHSQKNLQTLLNNVSLNDVLFFVGAGDIDRTAKELADSI